jgi:hypothetical protein
MMSKTRFFVPLLALMLCLSAVLFPVTAFAQTNEDTAPPTVTAQISGETLTITAKDDVGVAAVYINGQRFSTLANGTASVYLKDYAGTGAKVEVYATDTAGNRSQSVLLDNPYYQAPPAAFTPPVTSTPTPAPATSAPGSTPSSTAPPASSTPAPATPPATSTPAPAGSDGGGPDAADDTAAGTESAIGAGDSIATPGGAGTVTEAATDEDGKLFYTIETPAGNVFYLVIDMARTDGQNVYFLNAVTEDDLLALTETDGATTGGESAIPTPAPSPAPEPEPTPDPEPEEPEKESGGGGAGSIIFIIRAAAAVGGAGSESQLVKPRKQAAMRDEEE